MEQLGDDGGDDEESNAKKKDQTLSVFTTQSDAKSKRFRGKTRCCCCIPFAPRIITWNRTYLIRTFLKFYVCLSNLVAMVLYVQFFMNLFVEYIITCIVHWEEGYVVALIMIPFLVFIIEILVCVYVHCLFEHVVLIC